MMARRTVSSASPFEDRVGFSRAVRVGETIAVAGTAPLDDAGRTVAKGDVYGQTRRCLEKIGEALEAAGSGLGEVVRTRVMLKDAAGWEDAARAHGEVFGTIRPACTFVVVKGFIDPDWLVEVEADAVAAR